MLAAMVAASAAQPQALTSGQLNAVSQLAQVLALDTSCPEYVVNVGAIVFLGIELRLNLSDETPARLLADRVRQHVQDLEAAGPQLGSQVGWNLYGASGESLPNLLRKR
jgi:hypothetical protein